MAEFLEVSKTLPRSLSEVIDRVVAQVIYQGSPKAEVVEEPRQLLRAVGEGNPATTSSELRGQWAREGTDAVKPKDDDTMVAGNRWKRKPKKRKKRRRRLG